MSPGPTPSSASLNERPRPRHLRELFWSLTFLALQGFGGVLAVVQRELVEKRQWLSNEEFMEDWAVAQIMPGPNVVNLSIMLGWNVGLNAGGGSGPQAWTLGALGVTISMVGILLPSSLLTWQASRWGQRNRDKRGVRAFKQGMAPLVIGLLLATGWLLGSASGQWQKDWKLWLLSLVCTLMVWRTRIHLLWLLGGGALLGALRWV